MALFEVPGWSVPDTLLSQAGSNPRKRKRPSDAPQAEATAASSSQKLQTAVQNVERLMASLGSEQKESGNVKKKEKEKEKNKQKKGGDVIAGKKEKKEGEVSVQKSLQSTRQGKEKGKKQQKAKSADNKTRPSNADSATAHPASGSKANNARPTKKQKRDSSGERSSHTKTEKPTTPSAKSKPVQGGKKKADEGLTALQANMKQSLDGARFRWINETLYKSDSTSAHDMMRSNPDMFSEYHTGFRHQVHSWPDNPVSHYIASLSSRPAGTVVVDLGCGDAALAKALVPRGLVVLSYDLVSDGEWVVDADVCAKVPLPGGEGRDDSGSENVNAQVVDVVVCALSLMSTNWVGTVREAWRVLKLKGELKIAEVSSRFTDVEAFVSLVSAVGFKLKSKDESNTHFALFEFIKVPRQPKNDKEWDNLMKRGSVLKPCEYKRR